MHPNMPIPQDPNPKQIPPISLALTGNSTPTNYIPIIYKPLKDNPASELRHLRSFDPTALLSNASHRPKKSSFEIKLPNSDFRSISTSQKIPSARKFDSQTFPISILFQIELLSDFFTKLSEQFQIEITKEASEELLHNIIKQFFEILTRSAQSSRQRSAIYYPSFSNRIITSSPKIRQMLINFELFTSNQYRNKAYNNDTFDELDPYEPYFYKTFDANQMKFLNQDNPTEKAEYYQYTPKILQTLKYRGLMFKEVANETEKSYANEIDQIYNSYMKSDKLQPQVPKQTQFNLKANEIFGGAEDEENKRINRTIMPIDILEGFERMPDLCQTYLPLWHLSHISQHSDEDEDE